GFVPGRLRTRTVLDTADMDQPPVAEGAQQSGEEPRTSYAPCAECGRTLPTTEMIPHGGLWICASCKPVFVQRLKEGAELRGKMSYAGFWIRAGAAIID